uniref:Uncharacterized protein n=1 Tax=Parascaris univalens TaxID=6257 RepID=A0A914ZG32_PARUN
MSEFCETNPNSDLIAMSRRQKRRERILMNSGERIKTILSGPGGKECRNEPALEGGEDFKRPFSAAPSLSKCNESGLSNQNGDSVSCPESYGWNASLEELGITYRPKPWYCFIRDRRFRACIAVGIILRAMVGFSLISNVVVPWALSCFVFDFITAAQSKAKYPTRGLFLNALLYFGIDENFVIRIGFVLERAWNFIRDSLFAAFAFLMTHTVLYFAGLLCQIS